MGHSDLSPVEGCQFPVLEVTDSLTPDRMNRPRISHVIWPLIPARPSPAADLIKRLQAECLDCWLRGTGQTGRQANR